MAKQNWRFISVLPNLFQFKARNQADSADVSLFELDATDKFQMLQHPYLPGAPVDPAQAATKSYVDSAVGGSGAILADGSVPFAADQSMGGFALTDALEVDALTVKIGADLLPISETNIGGSGGNDAFTKYLLHADNSSVDASASAHVPLTDTMAYGAGHFSQAFNCTGGSKKLTYTSDADVNFGSGVFTIDFWATYIGGGNQHVLGRWLVAGGDWYSVFISSNTLRLGCPAIGLTLDVTNAIISDGNFHHFAIEREGNNFNIAIDGVWGTAQVNAGALPFTPSTNFAVGGISDSNTDQFLSSIDEVRVSKGVVRWPQASSFTPPTQPYGAAGNPAFDFGATELVSSAAPSTVNSLTNKSYVDTEVAAVQADADANTAAISALDAAVIKKNGSVAFTAAQSMGGFKLTSVADPTNPQDAETLAHTQATYIPLTQKAANNGVATLDSGGKIPATQLPNTVMEFKGTWDASTNTPTLADGVGNAGDVYLCNVAGTQDLGSGPITFAVGDWVVYNGTIWQKSINSNAVVSVNGQQGVVVLTTDDIAEGATNLYYTDARVLAAVAAANLQILKDGSVAFTGNQSMGGFKLTSLAAGSVSGDAVNVDQLGQAQEIRTLSGGEIAAKQLTLAATPLNGAAVRVTIYGGVEQAYSIDFTVTGSTLDWNGLGMDGLVIAGDKLLIQYFS